MTTRRTNNCLLGRTCPCSKMFFSTLNDMPKSHILSRTEKSTSEQEEETTMAYPQQEFPHHVPQDVPSVDQTICEEEEESPRSTRRRWHGLIGKHEPLKRLLSFPRTKSSPKAVDNATDSTNKKIITAWEQGEERGHTKKLEDVCPPSCIVSGLKKMQPSKKVRFFGGVKVRFTKSRLSFSKQEIENTWWQKEEYKSIIRSCSRQVYKIERGGGDTKYYARGLEGHTRIGKNIKTKARSKSILAVLKEQDRQLRNRAEANCDGATFALDAESIYKVYIDITSSCQMWASAMGLKDQREAGVVQEEEDKRHQQPLNIGEYSSKATTPFYPARSKDPVPAGRATESARAA